MAIRSLNPENDNEICTSRIITIKSLNLEVWRWLTSDWVKRTAVLL